MRDYLRDENDEPMDICEQGAQPSANVRQFKNIFEQTIQEQEAGDAPLRQEVPRRQLIDLSALHHAQENIPKIPEHQARNLASAGYQQQQVAEAWCLLLVYSSITSLSFKAVQALFLYFREKGNRQMR